MAEKSFRSNGEKFGSELEICIVDGVMGKNFIGGYIYGICIRGLRFPRNSTRPLSENEKVKYRSKGVYFGSVYMGNLGV